MLYLDRKYILYAFGILLFVWMVYEIEFKKPSPPNRHGAENFIDGMMWNQSKCQKAMDNFADAVEKALPLLKTNHYLEILSFFPAAFKDIDVYRQRFGFKQINEKITLSEWVEQQQRLLETYILNQIPDVIDLLENGDLSPLNIKRFESEMPFIFIQPFKQKLKDVMPQIKKERLKNCINWIIVRVVGSVPQSAGYENIIRTILKNKWDNNAGYKLVFGGTMSFTEKRKALKSFIITIHEETVSYKFDIAQRQRGKASIPEKTIVQFKDDTQTVRSFLTSWDNIEDISVTHKGPESLTFHFIHKRQTANFSTLFNNQRATLEKKLEAKLTTSIPPFKRIQ